MSRIPDFIIIGAMKCATSTLHEQLARQQGIFMSTPKEPNFFSDDNQFARGISWYTGLFNNATKSDICGESSTHYTKLPTYTHTVKRMSEHLPNHVKFIYVMRDPIDRMISQYIHEWTEKIINIPIDRAIMQRTELIDYSRYAMQLEPYLGVFGHERLLPVFFERLIESPQQEFTRICDFIGYSGEPKWDSSQDEQNVSVERLRKNPWRDAIIDFLPIRYLRRAFISKSARNRVRKWWSMPARPELSQDVRDRLQKEFDKDLSTLGHWFGLNVQCSNFANVARTTSPQWQEG